MGQNEGYIHLLCQSDTLQEIEPCKTLEADLTLSYFRMFIGVGLQHMHFLLRC